MNDYKIFTDPKNESCVTVIELKNRRLSTIHELIHYPLFQEVEKKELSYPTRQQLHSKRYYITKHQNLVYVLNNSNLHKALDKAKELLIQNSHYGSQVN